MSSTDPLQALRAAIKSSASITPVDADGSATADLSSASHLVIAGTSFPKSVPTRFSKPTQTEFYGLDAVYVTWLLRDAPGAEYMRKARENGLGVGQFVGVPDRSGLVGWLKGETNEHPRISPLAVEESTTPPSTPPTRATALPATPSTAAGASTSPTKRRYVADAADIEAVKKIKANEIELRDRNTVLRGTKSNNFNALRSLYSEKLKRIRESGKPGHAQPLPQSIAPGADAKLLARKARNVHPIIMISSSPTALITMHNVKRFLGEAVFEPSAAARARHLAEGDKAEDVIPLYRALSAIDSSGKERTSSTRWFIVDSTEALAKFGADAWERVVCVMTTGQAWQFRPYKWPEPRELFHHVKGVYVSWSNDPPNPKIKDWNVTELKIDPYRRHVDKAVVAHFWKTLDTWTMANKPWLMKG